MRLAEGFLGVRVARDAAVAVALLSGPLPGASSDCQREPPEVYADATAGYTGRLVSTALTVPANRCCKTLKV